MIGEILNTFQRGTQTRRDVARALVPDTASVLNAVMDTMTRRVYVAIDENNTDDVSLGQLALAAVHWGSVDVDGLYDDDARDDFRSVSKKRVKRHRDYDATKPYFNDDGYSTTPIGLRGLAYLSSLLRYGQAYVELKRRDARALFSIRAKNKNGIMTFRAYITDAYMNRFPNSILATFPWRKKSVATISFVTKSTTINTLGGSAPEGFSQDDGDLRMASFYADLHKYGYNVRTRDFVPIGYKWEEGYDERVKSTVGVLDYIRALGNEDEYRMWKGRTASILCAVLHHAKSVRPNYVITLEASGGLKDKDASGLVAYYKRLGFTSCGTISILADGEEEGEEGEDEETATHECMVARASTLKEKCYGKLDMSEYALGGALDMWNDEWNIRPVYELTNDDDDDDDDDDDKSPTGETVFSVNILEETRDNRFYRKVLDTTDEQQLVVMSLEPGEDIPLEIHPNTTQFLRIEGNVEGANGILKTGERLNVSLALTEDVSVTIPSNTWHYVANVSPTMRLQLYTIYSPPEHEIGHVDVRQPKSTSRRKGDYVDDGDEVIRQD